MSIDPKIIGHNLNEHYRAIARRRRGILPRIMSAAGNSLLATIAVIVAAIGGLFCIACAILPYAFIVFLIVVIIHFIRKFW